MQWIIWSFLNWQHRKGLTKPVHLIIWSCLIDNRGLKDQEYGKWQAPTGTGTGAFDHMIIPWLTTEEGSYKACALDHMINSLIEEGSYKEQHLVRWSWVRLDWQPMENWSNRASAFASKAPLAARALYCDEISFGNLKRVFACLRQPTRNVQTFQIK